MTTSLPHDPLPDPNASSMPSDSDYVPDPAVEALTPTTPEVLPPVYSSSESVTQSIASTSDGVGGMLTSTELIDESRTRALVEPFGAAPALRQSSRDLFKPELQDEPDTKLLDMFVTNQRLRELWNQLEALQEEVIQNVRADRAPTDTYQQDLLYASSLLLKGAANYDEAKQIMYRVRADLKREQRIDDDTHRYRPRLLLYYALWLIGWIVAINFNNQYRALIPDQIPILKLAYAPILFGVLGALFNGAMALHQHTSVQRDFDPVHLAWYLINPVLGGLLGLVTFVFFVVAASSFTPGLATNPDVSQDTAPLVIWLLAFVVGWQQNIIVKLLNRFLVAFQDNSGGGVSSSSSSGSGSAGSAAGGGKVEPKG
ncbi:MAG: hypothetical protein KF726_28440 [Anaerolineae bacterium]|nr:hypothetical protein [Anaerolineae bacterium]